MSPQSVLLTPDASWHLSLYPSAGEAGCSFQSSMRSPRMYVPPGFAADPERARAEAARRARAKLRRYAAANRLDRFGTLTYAGAGCHDPGRARADVAAFIRGLRAGLGGDPFPYVWVPEWHKGGHGLHLHFAVAKYVKHSLIADVWGRGFVSIKRITSLRQGAPEIEGARIAARYLSKYVAKTFDSPELNGRHRYDLAQGFQPKVTRFTGTRESEVLEHASQVMGASPARSWSSSSVEGWMGPPAGWFQWD